MTLASLSTEPPAGPTVMQQAHANGMRRAVALVKNHFKEPKGAAVDIAGALIIYLREWERTYKQGVSESPSSVDRTILDIRRDTVVQIMVELGRQPVPPVPVSGSDHAAAGDPGDRPTPGIPPGDF